MPGTVFGLIMIRLLSKHTDMFFSRIAMIGALLFGHCEAHSLVIADEAEVTLYQRVVGRAKRVMWNAINLSTALVISLCVNLMIFLHAVVEYCQRHKRDKEVELQCQLVRLKLESLTVQQLRDQAIAVGYALSLDSSRITKQVLVEMVLAKADRGYIQSMMKAVGHT